MLGPVAFANVNRHTLSLGGTSTYLNVFGGTIPDNTVSNTVVAKSGAGIWMLAGTNTYSRRHDFCQQQRFVVDLE